MFLSYYAVFLLLDHTVEISKTVNKDVCITMFATVFLIIVKKKMATTYLMICVVGKNNYIFYLCIYSIICSSH